MPPEQGLVVVVDPDDDPGFSDELESRADVTRGVVVVRPVPGVTETRRLAADVLIAMGKHYDAISRERQSRHGWDLARLWARAERVRHLVVWDAHRLPAGLWNELAVMARECGARLWMVERFESEGTRRARSEARCGPAALLSELPLPTISEGPFLDTDFVLPQESFLTFRWACMQRMAPECFSQIDAVYREAHVATRKWLDGRRWQDRPEAEEVARQLRVITSACRTPSETVVRLRAAQAAYFRDGVLVQVDDVDPRGEPDVPAAGLGMGMAARLRRLVTPSWAGALALGAAGGLSPRALARLKVGDLSCDGEVLTIAGESIDVPVRGAGLVRAQLLARLDAGAMDGDALLARSNQPFEAAVLGRRLNDAAHLAGVWRPADERRPPWHPASAEGHTVKLVALGANWEGVSQG